MLTKRTKDILQNVVFDLLIGYHRSVGEHARLDMLRDVDIIGEVPGRSHAGDNRVNVTLTTSGLEMTLLNVQGSLWVAPCQCNRTAGRRMSLEDDCRQSIVCVCQFLRESVEESLEVAGQPIREEIRLRDIRYAVSHDGE